MEITDVLKIQNKLIESLEKSESLCKLKLFNNELIEKMEFETKYPLVFSERLVRLLVKYGFDYNGHQHGKSYRSYDLREPSHPNYDKNNIKHCRVYYGDKVGEIIFMYNNKDYDYRSREFVSIPKEDMITEDYLKELLSLAAAPPCP